MLRCRDVARKIASDEYAQAGWLGRAGLRLHLMMCRHCRAYAGQLQAISGAVRKAWQAVSEDQQALERLHKRILEKAQSGKAVEDPSHPARNPGRE